MYEGLYLLIPWSSITFFDGNKSFRFIAADFALAADMIVPYWERFLNGNEVLVVGLSLSHLKALDHQYAARLK
jgi:hypothetical protein